MADAWTLIDTRYERGLSHLGPHDTCFYYMVHTDGGYQESEANQRMFNLKKPLDRRGLYDWRYKGEAIGQFANDLTDFLERSSFLKDKTLLVPMPTSKRTDSSEFDDRLMRVVSQAAEATGLAWLPLFDVHQDVVPSHVGGTRNVTALQSNITLNYDGSTLAPFEVILLIDDMITTGAHYVACRDLLQREVPHAQIAGIFWAKHQMRLMP